jgi:hypothetical protein
LARCRVVTSVHTQDNTDNGFTPLEICHPELVPGVDARCARTPRAVHTRRAARRIAIKKLCLGSFQLEVVVNVA